MKQPKDLLIIGDVHGCSYTLKKLVKEHWDPKTTVLIQVGDLVNKGPNSVKCVSYWMKLSAKYPDRVIMLRGNHEQFLIQSIKRPFLKNPASSLRADFKNSKLNLKKLKKWLQSLPLKWENEYILITHAGIAKGNKDPYKIRSAKGVLFNKGPLKNVGKVQVKGHSIVEGHKPHFNVKENAWYIDTGAWTKKYLSGLVLSPDGKLMNIVRIAIDKRDQK